MSLTTSAPAARGGLLGSQLPRLRSVPEYTSTTGPEVLDVCEMARLQLLPWQADVLNDCLGEAPGGNWSAQSVGLVVPRQNGKTEILIARILAGLFLLEEEEIIYSAHRADTSLGIFRRLVKYLNRSKVFGREIKSVRTTNGQEGVELRSGQRVGFRTRAQEGGRGFSADCIIFDEAFEISEDLQAALLPTLIARPNAQVWYTGTAVDQQVHRNGVVFARIRENGIAGDPDEAFFEWSAVGDLNDLDPDVLDDRELWAATNPSLGYHASEKAIALNRRSMKRRKFATECLCIGDWPATDEDALHVVDLAKWAALEDPESRVPDPVCFAFDCTPDRSRAAIGVAGRRPDGKFHLEVVEHKPGVAWVPRRLRELKGVHRPRMIACDAAGPVNAIVADVEKELGEEVRKLTAREHAEAFGMFYDGVEDDALCHLGQEELRSALDGAVTRPMGDGGQAWSRKNSGIDICPLVAVTLALWGAKNAPGETNIVFGSDVEPAAADPLEELVGVAAGSKGPKVRVLSQADTTVLRVPPRR